MSIKEKRKALSKSRVKLKISGCANWIQWNVMTSSSCSAAVDTSISILPRRIWQPVALTKYS